MVFIKYILIFFIIFISTYIGKIYSSRYSNRVEELEQIKNILNILKAKIKFTAIPLPEIFNQIYKENENNIGKIFENTKIYMQKLTVQEAWEKAMEEAFLNTSLNGEDINALKSLGKMLGNTDIERTSEPDRTCRESNFTKNKRSRRR